MAGSNNFQYSISVQDNGSEQLLKMRSASDELRDALIKNGQSLTETGNASRFLSEQLDPASNLAQQFAVRLGELQRAGGLPPGLALNLQDVTATGISAGDALEAFAKANQAVQGQVNATEGALLKEASGLNQVVAKSEAGAVAHKGLNLEMVAMNATMQTGSPLLMGFGQALAALGPAGIAAAAGLAALSMAGKDAADFQTELQQLQNNVGISDQALAQMGDTIKQVANDSNVSYASLGDGLRHIASFGFDAADSQKILTDAMMSASSTGGNTAETANLLAATLHHYGESADQAGTYTDILHLAAQRANATFEEFASNSQRATAVAALLNVPIDEVAASLAALTRNGFTASESQTQFVNILTHMIKPAAQAEKELGKLSKLTGIDLVGDFSAAGLSSKGLTGVMNDLMAAYQKMGLSQAEATGETMKLLNAQRGGLGMSVLLGKGQKDYTDNMSAFGDVLKGKITPTLDGFQKSQNTVEYQFGRLGNIVKTTSTDLGTGLLPTLTKVVDMLEKTGDALGKFSNALGNIPIVSQLFTIFGDGLATIGGALNLVGTALDDHKQKVEELAPAYADAQQKISAKSDAIIAASGAMGSGVDDASLAIASGMSDATGSVGDAATNMSTDYTNIGLAAVASAKTQIDAMKSVVTPLQATVQANKDTYDQLIALGDNYDQTAITGLSVLANAYENGLTHDQQIAAAKEQLNKAQGDNENATTDDIKKALEQRLADATSAYSYLAKNASTYTGDMAASWASTRDKMIADISAMIKAINLLSGAMGGGKAGTAPNVNTNNDYIDRVGSPSGYAAYSAATWDNSNNQTADSMKGLKDTDQKAADKAAKADAAAAKKEASAGKSAASDAKAAQAAKDRATADLQAAADALALGKAQDMVNAAEALAKDHTEQYATALRGLASDMKRVKSDEANMLAGPQAELDKATAKLKEMNKASEAALHGYDVQLHNLNEDLKKLQKEGADATAPLEANLKKAQAALQRLQDQAQEMGEKFAHMMQPLEDALYNIGQQEAAALAPLKKAIQELDDQLYALHQAEAAALQPIDDAIYAQNLGLQAARDHAQQVADVYDKQLIPLQQQLAALQYKQTQQGHNQELEGLGLNVTNLSERLANAKQGTQEYNALLKMQGDAQRNLDNKSKQYSLEDEIHSVEQAKTAAVAAANAQVAAQEKILAALQKQRAEVERTFELQARQLEAQKAAEERKAELTQREYDQQKALVQAQLDAITRQQTLYDRQQHDKEVAAQKDVTAAQTALTNEQAVQAARQKLVQDQIDKIQSLRDKKAWETSEAARLQQLEVNDLSDSVTKIKAFYKDHEDAIQKTIDKTNDEKDAVALTDAAIILSAKNYSKGLSDTKTARDEFTAQSKALSEYAGAFGTSLDDAAAKMADLAPKTSVLAPNITAAGKAITNDFVPAAQELTTKIEPAISGAKDTWMKYFGDLTNGGDATKSLAWYMNNHNQHGFWGNMISAADMALGIDGLMGMWNKRLIALWDLVHGTFEAEAAIVGGKAAPIGVAIIDGITAGAGNLLANAALQAAVAKAVNDAIQAGKDAAIAKSPSKKSHDEIGIPIGQGIGNGIDASAPYAQDKMRSLVNGVIGAGATASRGGAYLPAYAASGAVLAGGAGAGSYVDNSTWHVSIDGGGDLPAPGNWQGWKTRIRDISVASRSYLGKPLGQTGGATK